MQQEMKYVFTVYQEGSFSKAAQKLYITQPALTISVQKVEAMIGFKLFDRSTHPLKLTPAGELYIQKYYEIKMLENELTCQINELSDLKKGDILIGGTQYILSYVLAPVLSAFAERFPNINIHLIESSSDKLDGLLLSGSIDLCLKCDEINPSLSAFSHAFREHLLLAVPKEYVTQFQLPDTGMSLRMIEENLHLSPDCICLEPHFLPKLPFLFLTSGTNLHERCMELFHQNGLEPNIRMQIQQNVTAYHLAGNGLGATLTSDITIKKNKDLNLVFYKIDSPLMVRDFFVIIRSRSYISKAISEFIDILHSYYA
ncbi:LysR family transcriptional regulator [Youngiibacter multivorans]|uniref:DNA-binding transcriptional LysR family regulator n=1 Tax=Youngiibacter multivorans TaxID=937251 RepID=A0ABS4G4Y3_9CLOT|nr:LysR family transcriptional regulator [Youngiibacter multivorans]MBP1919620.1 DNA-binding transcriptional LysR family regulator [Youngiibacter multivorans]